jgi:hypothetical protein
VGGRKQNYNYSNERGARTMVYQGTVQNGVVVFPNGIQLPEGSSVRVELVAAQPTPADRSETNRTLFDVLTEHGILGCFDGPTDLSTNRKHMEGFGEPRHAKNSH